MIHGLDYKEMTKELLRESGLEEHLMQKRSFLKKDGKEDLDKFRIGIKPNLVSPSTADWGATTHPQIVAGIIEYLQECGYTNVVMLEGSWVGDKTEEAARVCGYLELSEKYQVPFLDMQKEKGVQTDCAGVLLNICKAALDVDFLINVPVLKGHCQTRITCALKNLKGLIPNSEKRRFHAMGLHKPIAHLNAGIRQDFIVTDNICGDLDFEDGGHPVEMNRILAGCDPVLMDAYVCQMMHYEAEDVPYLKMAEELNVGCADISKAQICFCRKMDVSETVFPKSRKVIEVEDLVEEVESCSACYGYLIPALNMLKEDGLLDQLPEKICIGQGFRGRTGELGIGHCTRKFRNYLDGCPPTENQIYEFLKKQILSGLH